MNNKVTNVIMLVLGASIGSLVTWKCLDNKYAKIAQEEIDSVKEAFAKHAVEIAQYSGTEETESTEDAREKAELAKSKPDISEYTVHIQNKEKINYNEFSSIRAKTIATDVAVVEPIEIESDPEMPDKPYVIPPEDFGDIDGYETISLTYYSDKALADDRDQLVEDIELTVGFASLGSFGQYEDDSVFVRNHALKCDYEILLDHRKYSEVIGRKPHEVID